MGLTNQDPGCCCGCTVNIAVFNCNTDALVPGASVQVTGNGVSLSGTTGSNGEVAFTLPESGDYTIQASALGTQTFLQVVPLACGQGADIWLQESTSSCFEFSAVGCGGSGTNVPGAILSIAGVTYSLPATVCLAVPTALGSPPPVSTTFPYTVSASNYQDATGSVTLTGNCFAQGGPVAVSMTPAAGFVCFCGGGNCPIPATTLSLTDSVYGNVTLAFSDPGGIQQWQGTLTINYPESRNSAGQILCQAANGVVLTYTLSCGSVGLSMQVTYTSFQDGSNCPDETGTGSGFASSQGVTASFCPMNLVFTYLALGSGGFFDLYPAGATLTVTP
jgi:hypothetical protein